DCGAGDGCNVDKCLAGSCVLAQVPDGDPCDDGLECTEDTCLAGTCQGIPADGHCLIEGACYADGETQDGNLCATCQPAVTAGAWTLLADGTGCEDGYDCTEDTCVNGECEHKLMETACVLDGTCYYDGDTKPGDACMSCQPALAQIVFSAVDCDDGDPCTVDSCNGDAGGCVNVLDESLDPSCVSWAPPGLTQVGPCLAGQTDCVFTVDDDSEILESLQRIYQGASLYFRTPWLDTDGTVLPHQFPATQGATPVEETCCSTGGQGGPDLDGNDLCDTDVPVWSTWTWSDLGFTPHTAACEAYWLDE
ncbi:MAG: hypothetical protein VX938_08555, partial [Myxococcota bacterium]|nr:hypothetical protein [Myxococcota bacterium]